MKLNVICGVLKKTVCLPAFAVIPPAVQIVAEKGSPLTPPQLNQTVVTME